MSDDGTYSIHVLAAAATGDEPKDRNTIDEDSKNPGPHLAAAQEALDAAHERKRQAKAVLDETRKRVNDLERQLDAALRDRAEAERTDRDAEDAVRFVAEAMEKAQLQRPCAWNTMYNSLVAYQAKHGDTLVPHPKPGDKDSALYGLGRWVGNQRVYYKYYMNSGDTKRINPHRIAALERIGFVWDMNEYRWQKFLKDLSDYRDVHGDFNVPRTYPENQGLSDWVSKCRVNWRRHVRGQPAPCLTEQRIVDLKLIGFEFPTFEPVEQDAVAKVGGGTELESSTPETKPLHYAKMTSDEFWEDRYEALVAFRSKYGHCQIRNRSVPYIKGYSVMTKWAAQQKREYIFYLEGKPSILNPERYPDRIQRLEGLGFKFRRPLSEPRKSPQDAEHKRKRKK